LNGHLAFGFLHRTSNQNKSSQHMSAYGCKKTDFPGIYSFPEIRSFPEIHAYSEFYAFPKFHETFQRVN